MNFRVWLLLANACLLISDVDAQTQSNITRKELDEKLDSFTATNNSYALSDIFNQIRLLPEKSGIGGKLPLYIKLRKIVLTALEKNNRAIFLAQPRSEIFPKADSSPLKISLKYEPPTRAEYEQHAADDIKRKAIAAPQAHLQASFNDLDSTMQIYCIQAFGSSAKGKHALRAALRDCPDGNKFYDRIETLNAALNRLPTP